MPLTVQIVLELGVNCSVREQFVQRDTDVAETGGDVIDGQARESRDGPEDCSNIVQFVERLKVVTLDV